jgi:predicted dehydrogenase
MLLRGAIIGFGSVAVNAHLPLFQKNDHFSIDAVVEPSSQRAALARKILPHARIYTDCEKMFSENVLDFVDICTPPCFHEEHVLAAARAGLHVLCEKPLATSRKSFFSIIKAASEFEKVIFTVNNWKHAPIWKKVVKLVQEDGAIGKIYFLSLNVLRTSMSGGGVSGWRKCIDIAGGGILLDHGWHNFYLILSLIKEVPLSLSAHMHYNHHHGSSLEETVEVTIKFPQAEAKLFLTWQAAGRQNYGHIWGDKGSIYINDDHLVLKRQDCAPVQYDFPHALSTSSHHLEWMEPVLSEFYREVVVRETGQANLKEAAWCTQLAHHAYESHKKNARFIPIINPFESTISVKV